MPSIFWSDETTALSDAEALSRDDGMSLKDRVADFVRTHIAENDLKPGDNLPSESEVTKRLGISRTIVREAWNGMVAIGAIEASAGRRPRVGRLGVLALSNIIEHALATGQGSLLQLLEMRRTFEVEMAGLAALRRSEDLLEKMQATVRAMANLLQNESRYAALDLRLHHLIAEASGNPFHVFLVDAFQVGFQQSMQMGFRSRVTAAEIEKVQLLHEDIVRAISAGSREDATLAMARHFDDAMRTFSRQA